MHNVARSRDDEERGRRLQKSRKDATSYNALLDDAQSAHDQQPSVLKDVLDKTTMVLRLNPDYATLWNWRRSALLQAFEQPRPQSEVGDAALSERRAATDAELQLTQECLGVNPKSYPVWHHRTWVLGFGQCGAPILVRELKLTAKLLTLDERNFHCWTYRRFVASAMGVPAEDEAAYSLSKINANFSNYSAWHYRSVLLPRVHPPADLAAVLCDELQLLRNAFYTAPEDQSAWFYHRWVLGQLEPVHGRCCLPEEDWRALLRDELAMIDELLGLEPDCKWPLATAALLRSVLGGADPSASDEQLRNLVRVDPMRRRMYEEQLQHRALGGS